MDDIARERSYPTPAANSTLLPLLLLSLASQKNSPNTKNYFRQKYDYIVVGAGSAGSVVASRLSELPCVTVLLLEAGKAPPVLTEVPLYCSFFSGSDVDWKYQTVKQRYTARGFPHRIIKVARGKMLGGSSSLNNNMFVRGSHKNFENWATGGARGWNYTDVLPYFKKMEGCCLPPEYCGDGYHGLCGPVTNSIANYEPTVLQPLLEAHAALGLPLVDYNGPSQTGSCYQQVTTRIGQRCGTAKAYLVPKENKNNLDIVINALVTKVVINKERVATGVRVDFKGRSWFIEAGREVILSAGAINSPQLLMLSGIGPAAHLTEHRIPVVADLPVGLNLQDHPLITVTFEINRNIKSYEEKINDVNTLLTYIYSRSGLLSSNVVFAGFEINALSKPAVDFPIVQTIFLESSLKRIKSARTKELYDQVYRPYENRTTIGCIPTVLQPKTRGKIKLRSANPYDKPIVDMQYLEEPADLNHLVEGMKFCYRLIQTTPLRRIGARRLTTLFPGCEELVHNEDAYLRCVAGLMTLTNNHFCGTAKMGDPRDLTTVLDPQLRVKTIRGLRVVDASVMPTIMNGNINVPTIMIGEKASDMIKETVQCPRHPPFEETFCEL